MRLTTSLCLCCCLLTGCAAVRGNYGDQFTPQQIEKIKRGTTTRTEVASLLGAPERILEVNDHEFFHYYHYDVKMGVVLFFSRTNVKSDDLFIVFNKGGVVEDVVYGNRPERQFQFWPFGD
ncbi:MAG: outer membrane protein assembly factor BamE domain-containing protein [Nitrospiraceae bacterium]